MPPPLDSVAGERALPSSALPAAALSSAQWTAPDTRASACFLLWMGLLCVLDWPLPAARAGFAADLLLGCGLLLLAGSPWLRAWFLLWGVLPYAYTEAGSFGTTLLPSVEDRLIALDRRCFGVDWWHRPPAAAGPWNSLLETAYLANYLLIFVPPMYLMIRHAWGPRLRFLHPLRFLRATRPVDPELLASLLGSLLTGLFLCYALFPLLPAVTPRLYFPQFAHTPHGLIHDLNAAFLARYSIPWGILPSGHVAGPVALAVALWGRRQRAWALLYLASGVLIGIATVHGAYHFVADAVSGGMAGAAGAGLVQWQLARQRPGSKSHPKVAPMAA